MVLSCSRIDGVAGGVYDLFRTDDNIHCRKDSPCSARGKASCIHSRIACAFARLRRPKAPPRVTFLPFPPRMPASCLRGRAPEARCARSAGNRENSQLCSAAER